MVWEQSECGELTVVQTGRSLRAGECVNAFLKKSEYFLECGPGVGSNARSPSKSNYGICCRVKIGIYEELFDIFGFGSFVRLREITVV